MTLTHADRNFPYFAGGFSLSYWGSHNPWKFKILETEHIWAGTSIILTEQSGRGGYSTIFLYGGGPPLNLLYSIFHDFVYLLLTNGTPFTYLAYNFVSLLTAGNPHCHKIGISHKCRTLSRRVRGWASGWSLPVQILVTYISGISSGASPYRPS